MGMAMEYDGVEGWWTDQYVATNPKLDLDD